MNPLRRLACLVFGHAPVVERRDDDSVLLCERCGHLFEVFVKGLYARDEQGFPRVPAVEGQPERRRIGPPAGNGFGTPDSAPERPADVTTKARDVAGPARTHPSPLA